MKTGLRILGAEASSDEWNINVVVGSKHTSATVTAMRKPSTASASSAVPGTPEPEKSPLKESDSEDADDDDEEVHGSTSPWSRRTAKPG